ncbi:hypothetical protein ASZ90_007165 [hydrocarbon metagenome]|uniref:Uncharacterized protein n=1 Tax=hydrocarbon metagenome TaxID=938273 RepID=A0A0W8FQ41_9ZZZZ
MFQNYTMSLPQAYKATKDMNLSTDSDDLDFRIVAREALSLILEGRMQERILHKLRRPGIFLG